MSVTAMADRCATVLALRGIEAGYGEHTVLRGVDLDVPAHKIVTLLGPNGAGKTTLMRVAAGLLTPTRGTVVMGSEDLSGQPPARRARAGLCLIPEGRGIFRSLSVRENLALFSPRGAGDNTLERVTAIFPLLGRRLGQSAGTLSGGEQQMLALARAFLADPSVVLVDEVSMGLAPLMVDQIFETLTAIAAQGVSVLLVEQYVRRALDLADYVYLMNRGEIVLAGPTEEISYADVAGTYLA